MSGIRDYSDRDLEDAAIADAIRSYIALRAREWQREQQRWLLNQVFTEVDYQRDVQGRHPDVRAIIDKVWLKRNVPDPVLVESK